MPNYRVLVHYDPDKSVFVARAPELEHCSAEGATRAEALTKIEEEMTAQLANMKEQGGQAPAAVDDGALAFSGELTAKVSNTLHRELAWQARLEGIELGQLLSELLPAALELRRRARRPEQPRDQPRRQGGQGQGQGGRYHAIMEDKASFLEYVRGLEQGGAGRPPRGPRRGGGGRQGGDDEGT